MAIRHPSPAAKWLFIFPRLGITRQIITQVDSIKARADGGRGGSPFHDVVRPAAEEKRRRKGEKKKEKRHQFNADAHAVIWGEKGHPG